MQYMHMTVGSSKEEGHKGSVARLSQFHFNDFSEHLMFRHAYISVNNKINYFLAITINRSTSLRLSKYW